MYLACSKAFALCRMGVGLYFLVQGLGKLSWFTSGDALAGTLFGNAAAQPARPGMVQNAEAFYRPFLEQVVQPNIELFAQLVALGELAVGACLLAGLLTRVGALTAMFLVLNYMLAKGLPSTSGSMDRLFFLLNAGFSLGSAGLAWGLDGLWRRQLVRNPVTRWLAGLPPEETREAARVPHRPEPIWRPHRRRWEATPS